MPLAAFTIPFRLISLISRQRLPVVQVAAGPLPVARITGLTNGSRLPPWRAISGAALDDGFAEREPAAGFGDIGEAFAAGAGVSFPVAASAAAFCALR